MIRTMKWLIMFSLLALTTLLSACGGSGSDDSVPPKVSGSEGIAVDPYIVGAVFQEVTTDGRTLQTSSPTDSQGRFSFPQAVQTGSIIEMKNDSRGYHAGAPFSGLIKRQVAGGEVGRLVVSPLTTLLANGASSEEVLGFLQEAGLAGMTGHDLLADPMAGLEELGAGEVTDDSLRNLHAAMAANALMHLLNDYTAGAPALATPSNRQLMADLVEASRQVLNPSRFAAMAAAIAADPEFAGHSLRLAEMIRFAAETMQTIGELADGGSLPSQSAIAGCVDDALETSPEIVRGHLRSRLGTNPPATDPQSPVVDPEEVFAARCAGCHNLGTSSNFYNLVGDGGKVQAKFASGLTHMGKALSAVELEALAGYLDGLSAPSDPTPEPTPDPTPAPTPDGGSVFTTRCADCHNLGTSNDFYNLAGDGAKVQAKFASGLPHMGNALTAAEVLAVVGHVDAAVSPTPTPDPDPVPTVDGQSLYDTRCAGCHRLGSYDASGTPDLAGRAGLIGAKTAAGHGGGPFAAEALASLVGFVEANTPATLPDTPPPPSYSDCTACHGQPPTGTASPNTAGAHAAHNALPGLQGNCAVCHQEASHNGWVDLKFPAVYNAKTGTAVDNGDGTCSNISCHGGGKTPDWWTGKIDVNSQCTSCHSAGTGQYNGYSSGRHAKHWNEGVRSCTSCHDTSKLATAHLAGLDNQGMDTPAATVGGGETRVSSYTARTCTNSCHERESW